MKNYNEMSLKELRAVAKELGLKKINAGGKDYILPMIMEAVKAQEVQEKQEVKKASKREATLYAGKSIRQWSEELGIPQATLRARLMRGWNPEEVFTAENHRAKGKADLLEYDGKAMTLNAWAQELGISTHTLFARINRLGWSVEKALSQAPRRKSYEYYLTMRPVGPGCQPKDGLVSYESYSKRIFVKAVNREVWALVVYNRQLTEKELKAYEMIPA